MVDVERNAVADAEVMVGKTVDYTGANGEFELTVRKRRLIQWRLRGADCFGGRD